MRLEGKQNYFPREQTLSVLLYSEERKINNIHTTIVFDAKKSKIYSVNEFKIKRNLLKLLQQHVLLLIVYFLVFYILHFNTNMKNPLLKFTCFAAILFLYVRTQSISVASIDINISGLPARNIFA